MYLIVGLGNPEEEYSKTRHNMGFDTINKIANIYGIEMKKKKFDSLYAEKVIEGEKIILLKPQTYMNLSGKAIIQVIKFYKIPIENVIVVYDDMDIEPGKIKVRKKGGPGSHNGMKSVVAEVKSDNFSRIRVGIGKPKYKDDTINYVIGSVTEEEQKKLEIGTSKAAEALISILKNGIDNTMNKFN